MATNPELIITHPGSAHFDEVAAVSLILASFPQRDFRMERREPTTEELDDPAVWVVDTGERLEPLRRNFDHHQSRETPAAFVLVARFLGLEQTLTVQPWWDFKDSVDRFGPVRSATACQAGDDLVNRNPVEDWLTQLFAEDPQACVPLLRSFGAFLIGDARRLQRQLEYWRSCRRLRIGGVEALIGETRESAGLEVFQRREAHPPEIVISRDSRNEGWRLFRFEGAPVDFTRIAHDPRIAFAHKSGFLAKTACDLPLEEVIALVEQALVQGSDQA